MGKSLPTLHTKVIPSTFILKRPSREFQRHTSPVKMSQDEVDFFRRVDEILGVTWKTQEPAASMVTTTEASTFDTSASSQPTFDHNVNIHHRHHHHHHQVTSPIASSSLSSEDVSRSLRLSQMSESQVVQNEHARRLALLEPVILSNHESVSDEILTTASIQSGHINSATTSVSPPSTNIATTANVSDPAAMMTEWMRSWMLAGQSFPPPLHPGQAAAAMFFQMASALMQGGQLPTSSTPVAPVVPMVTVTPVASVVRHSTTAMGGNNNGNGALPCRFFCERCQKEWERRIGSSQSRSQACHRCGTIVWGHPIANAPVSNTAYSPFAGNTRKMSMPITQRRPSHASSDALNSRRPGGSRGPLVPRVLIAGTNTLEGSMHASMNNNNNNNNTTSTTVKQTLVPRVQFEPLPHETVDDLFAPLSNSTNEWSKVLSTTVQHRLPHAAAIAVAAETQLVQASPAFPFPCASPSKRVIGLKRAAPSSPNSKVHLTHAPPSPTLKRRPPPLESLESGATQPNKQQDVECKSNRSAVTTLGVSSVSHTSTTMSSTETVISAAVASSAPIQKRKAAPVPRRAKQGMTLPEFHVAPISFKRLRLFDTGKQ